MKKIQDLGHEDLVHILGGHAIGVNIQGCQPNLKMTIYVLKSAVYQLIWAPLYSDDAPPQPPPTTLYTAIRLQTAFILFWVGYLSYGILLTALKYCINNNFKSAPRSQKLQHVVEALNIPGQKLVLFSSSQKSIWSGPTIPLFHSFLQKYMTAQWLCYLRLLR